jgi:hypothetical protein
MRKYCLDCVIKHLGQAFITQIESNMNYPEHILLTIGHLAEASEECDGASKDLAEEIRQHRLKLMGDSLYDVPYFELYTKVKLLIEKVGCGNCKKAKVDFQEQIKKQKEKHEKES